MKQISFFDEKVPISIAHIIKENDTEYIWYPFMRKKYFLKNEQLYRIEEKLRAYTIKKLIIDYGYDPQLIIIEKGIFKTGRADIILLSPIDNKPSAIFELAYNKKFQDLKFDIEKGIEEARKLNAQYFIQIIKDQWNIYDIRYNKKIKNFISFAETNQIIKYIKGKKNKDLAIIDLNNLKKIFKQIHNILWGQGEIDPIDALEITIELLIAKRYDEKTTKINEAYKFQIIKHSTKKEESVYKTITRISNLIDDLINKKQVFFKKSNIKKIENKLKTFINTHPSIISHFKQIIKLLEGYNISLLKDDELGHAFELFLSSMFRGPYGQYFTPPEIVKLKVLIASPEEDDYIIDLSAGSGRILQYALEHMKKTMGRIPRTFQVFGADIYEKIVILANKYFLLITEDMETGYIVQCNSLTDHHIISQSIQNKASKVITNPPLSKKQIDISNISIFETLKNKKIKKFPPSALFLELYFHYLKEGGLLITTIDDGILNTKNFKHFRELLLNKYDLIGVIKYPKYAFLPSGADLQSSMLILAKKNITNPHPYVNNKVFFAYIEDIGYDATGRKTNSEIEFIKDKFFQFVKGYNINDKKGNNIVFSLEKEIVLSNKTKRIDFTYYYHSYIKNLFIKTKQIPLISLDKICDKVFKGKTFKRENYTKKKTPIFSLKALNITQLGLVNLEQSNYGSYVSINEKKIDSLKKLKLQHNDILILCSAHNPEYIYKKISIFDETLLTTLSKINKDSFIIPSGEIIVVRQNKQNELHPYYLLWVLKNLLKDFIMAGITGISGHIYEEDIQSLQIPILPNHKEIGETYKEKIYELYKLQEKEKQLIKEINNICLY